VMRLFLAQTQPPPSLPPLPHPEKFEVPPVVEGQPWWLYAGIILLICILVSLVLWLLFRSRQAAPAAIPRPWNAAMDALHALRARADSQPHAETAHQVSEILRRYFWERYHIPAPFRTRRELFEMEAPKASQKVVQYAPLAALWDELSFAPVPVTQEEALTLVNRAISHLQEDQP
jgi:hypothetical protein